MSLTAIVPEPTAIRNYMLQHRLPLYYSKPVLAHLETYTTTTAATAKGFRGKETDLAEYSGPHSAILLPKEYGTKKCYNTKSKRNPFARS